MRNLLNAAGVIAVLFVVAQATQAQDTTATASPEDTVVAIPNYSLPQGGGFVVGGALGINNPNRTNDPNKTTSFSLISGQIGYVSKNVGNAHLVIRGYGRIVVQEQISLISSRIGQGREKITTQSIGVGTGIETSFNLDRRTWATMSVGGGISYNAKRLEAQDDNAPIEAKRNFVSTDLPITMGISQVFDDVVVRLTITIEPIASKIPPIGFGIGVQF